MLWELLRIAEMAWLRMGLRAVSLAAMQGDVMARDIQNAFGIAYLATQRDTQDECAVCGAFVFLGISMTRLPCVHSFHSCCVHQWISTEVQAGRSARCPQCNTELMTMHLLPNA